MGYVVTTRPTTQRAVLKFARYVGCNAFAGRFTPGAFTNQIQTAFREPRLLLITDPRADHQQVTESSYANIPIVAFANVDSPTKFIDIAIPCNNKSTQSIGLMWWMLAREVLRLRGSISRDLPWEVMPDLFAPDKEDWGADAAVTDWAADGQPAVAPVAAPAAIIAPGAAPVAAYQVTEDWAAQTETSDWAAASANPAEAQGNSWGGSSQW